MDGFSDKHGTVRGGILMACCTDNCQIETRSAAEIASFQFWLTSKENRRKWLTKGKSFRTEKFNVSQRNDWDNTVGWSHFMIAWLIFSVLKIQAQSHQMRFFCRPLRYRPGLQLFQIHMKFYIAGLMTIAGKAMRGNDGMNMNRLEMKRKAGREKVFNVDHGFNRMAQRHRYGKYGDTLHLELTRIVIDLRPIRGILPRDDWHLKSQLAYCT